jgi:hypothetical protein
MDHCIISPNLREWDLMDSFKVHVLINRFELTGVEPQVKCGVLCWFGVDRFGGCF